MDKKFKWNEGDGYITTTFVGSGDGPITISSDANEGIDREQKLSISTSNNELHVDITIKQIGLREVFICTDGDFILEGGDTFNVLKGN